MHTFCKKLPDMPRKLEVCSFINLLIVPVLACERWNSSYINIPAVFSLFFPFFFFFNLKLSGIHRVRCCLCIVYVITELNINKSEIVH